MTGIAISELAAEEEEEEDEGIAEQNPSSNMADAAEVPKDTNKKEKEEDDELAEYDLDKYDEEDAGEREGVFTLVYSLFSVSYNLSLVFTYHVSTLYPCLI